MPANLANERSMKTSFLDFEQSIADLESKIEELRFVQDDSAVDISEEIERLEKKSGQLTKDIYAKLTPGKFHRWHVTRSALIRWTICR
jgi:acetyl-CoA carboxylase carboxyl transferase subunit alpha